MANDWYRDSQPTAHKGLRRIDAGRWLVRVRVKDPRNGKEVQKQEVFEGTLAQALTRQDEMRDKALAGAEPERMHFDEYSALLSERKVQLKEISTAKGLERWQDTLKHHLLPKWKTWKIDTIRSRDIRDWLAEVNGSTWERRKPDGTLIASGTYSPNTVNGWLRILLTILREAKRDFDWAHDPTDVPALDTGGHRTYTSEEPNSLTLDEVPVFFEAAQKLYPQHYPFLLLGTATGRRPCELRALRRKDPNSDVRWEEGVLLVRRSQTRGTVSEKTKTDLDLEIGLPEELMSVLRLHAAGLNGEARKSELLFPSDEGGFRSPSFLDKPIERICTEARIRKNLTPRFMRRTWQDLSRAAGVKQIVTQSVCGHLTDSMTNRYSTVSKGEQREAVGVVLKMIRRAA